MDKNGAGSTALYTCMKFVRGVCDSNSFIPAGMDTGVPN